MWSYKNDCHLLHTIGREKWKFVLDSKLVNWLAKHYNLHVKVINLDNEINQIKTTEWYNQNSISFESCALNTYAQNGGAKRFR